MTAREVRELALACALQLVTRLALRTVRFKSFLRAIALRLPVARSPLGLPELASAASRSRRLCRGSCLTESVVMTLLARRHGHAAHTLTIGVALTDGRFQAHAWTGEGGTGFVPLWREDPARGEKSWLA